MLKVSSAVKLGFVCGELRSSIAYPAPRILQKSRKKSLGSFAVQSCPAVNFLERRIIEVLAPFSLLISCKANENGNFDFYYDESKTRIGVQLINDMVTFMPRNTWRSHDVPVVQVSLPHFFVCDELCYLSQMPAWASSNSVRFPGEFIGGRFQTDIWPRSLNLSFEWSNRSASFEMTRGQPVCYLYPETVNPASEIQLVAAHLTDELINYRKRFEGVVALTGGTFNLVENLIEYRPKKLLCEVVS